MILSIYAIEAPRLAAAKAVRSALWELHVQRDGDPENRPTFTDACGVLDAFAEDGVAKLAEVDGASEGISALLRSLRADGVFVTVGSPEKALRAHKAEKLREQGATPEAVFAELAPGDPPPPPAPEFRSDAAAASALALVVMSKGNPLAACAHAVTLCRAQGVATLPVWRAVQQDIIATFPWCAPMLADDDALL